METGDDDGVTGVEQFVNALRRDVCNFGFRMQTVSNDTGLRTGQRCRFCTESLQRHRQQRNRRLLTGGEQNIHLALRWLRVNFFGKFD